MKTLPTAAELHDVAIRYDEDDQLALFNASWECQEWAETYEAARDDARQAWKRLQGAMAGTLDPTLKSDPAPRGKLANRIAALAEAVAETARDEVKSRRDLEAKVGFYRQLQGSSVV